MGVHPPQIGIGIGCDPINGIPFWLVGEFTTHFRTYFSGWIESDVHWGYDLDFDPWPFDHVEEPLNIPNPKFRCAV